MPLAYSPSFVFLRPLLRWKHLSYNPSYLEDAVKTCLHSRWTLCSLLVHKVKAEKSQLSVNSSIISDSVKFRDTGLQKPFTSAGIFLANLMFFRELNPKMTSLPSTMYSFFGKTSKREEFTWKKHNSDEKNQYFITTMNNFSYNWRKKKNFSFMIYLSLHIYSFCLRNFTLLLSILWFPPRIFHLHFSWVSLLEIWN